MSDDEEPHETEGEEEEEDDDDEEEYEYEADPDEDDVTDSADSLDVIDRDVAAAREAFGEASVRDVHRHGGLLSLTLVIDPGREIGREAQRA